MQTPTVLHPTTCHLDAPKPGACPCTPGAICPECMGKLQRHRHDRAVLQWLREWDSVSRPAPRRRPLLRLVLGGRS